MKGFSPIIMLFCIVSMELTALGMMIPLIPYIARNFQADDLQIGLLMSVYSIMQCIVSPLWGKWSDRLGRKPILVLSLLFTSISYVWFAFAPNLLHLFLSRMLAGIFGVTVSTSFAFMSDVTSSKNRSKNMGLIGASFGLGFVIGPALGGLLGMWKLNFGFSQVALGASLICFIGFMMSFLMMREFQKKTSIQKSLSDESTGKNLIPQSKGSVNESVNKSVKKESFIRMYIHAFRALNMRFTQAFKQSSLRNLLFLFFILSLSLTLIEAPLFLIVQDRFHLSASMSSLGFAYIGLILAFTQGFFVRYFIPKWGEENMIIWCFIILCFGFVGICIPEIRYLGLAVTLMSFGYAVCYTCLTGSISLVTSQSHQGGVLGLHQSLSSFARVLGPVLGGWMYRDVSHGAPFLVAGFLALCCWFFALFSKRFIPSFGKISSTHNQKLIKESHVSVQKTKDESSSFTDEEREYVEINLVQVDNILTKRISCVFYNLSKDVHLNLPSKVKTLLDKCQNIDEKQLLQMSFASDHPVVLVCKDGQRSLELALRLSKKYANIYYLQGGWLHCMKNDI